jgi:DNA-binding NarL/FixJ family response regulator
MSKIDRETRLFSLAITQDQWIEEASAALLGVLGPKDADWWCVLWRSEAGVVPVSATWNSESARRMAVEFPETAGVSMPAQVARAGLTTITEAGLWTEASQDFFEDIGRGDAVGIAIAESDLRGGLVAGRLLEKRTPRAVADRRTVARVARTVALAWRTRRVFGDEPPVEVADAVLTPAGVAVHAAGVASEPSSLQALRTAVVLRERARAREAADVDGATVWSDLVHGRWSLVDDYEDGGQRYVLAVRNDAFAEDLALTPLEARVVELSVLGESPKAVAADLGLSLSRTYGIRQEALDKLCARSMGDLIALARQLPTTFLTRVPLGRDGLMALGLPPSAPDLSTLTDAELEVLRDLMCCMPQRQIAARRRRSPRTVANQIQSIYRKLNVSGRNQLFSLLRVADPNRTTPGPAELPGCST